MQITESNSMIARMIDRRLVPVIERRIAEVPAVVLLGARQTGKTTLAPTVRSNLADAIVLILADRQFESCGLS